MRLPWIIVAENAPLVIELQPGDGYFVDMTARLFHYRQTGSSGMARTITHKLDLRVDAADKEVDLEFRIGDALGAGPDIFIHRGRLGFDKRDCIVSSAGMFQRLSAALNSPVWNPFGYFPEVTSHRADVRTGALADMEGRPLGDEPASDLPRQMTVRLTAERTGPYDLDGRSSCLPAGRYRARPWECSTGTLLRLDGDDTENLQLEKKFMSVDEFSEAASCGEIEVLSQTKWEHLPLWQYTI